MIGGSLKPLARTGVTDVSLISWVIKWVAYNFWPGNENNRGFSSINCLIWLISFSFRRFRVSGFNSAKTFSALSSSILSFTINLKIFASSL